LGDSFGLFARAQHPAGVALISNLLDQNAISAIDSRLLILMGQQDWNPWQEYGRTGILGRNMVAMLRKHTTVRIGMALSIL